MMLHPFWSFGEADTNEIPGPRLSTALP